ncbi:Os04g0619200, partial [Oryza sativa Japonica Group]
FSVGSSPIDRDLSGKATNGKWGNLYAMDSSVQFYWKHLNTHQIQMWYVYVIRSTNCLV